MRLPNQPHPLPLDQALPVLLVKAAKHRAKADQLLADVVAEVVDRQRTEAAQRERAARRSRLTAAGVLKPKG
jgi:hypothetical protein